MVHYVVLGIDAPPLNDDDADGIPDYVENVGAAADRALAYYERRGFRAPLADEAGPDARPDVYVSRFSPGTLGVAFPAAAAAGGAFAVVANNLDPSAGRSFASVYATVAHELFHLVQFSYFGPRAQPSIPTWILEGTASALETRANPRLDDLVSTIQLRRWLSSTGQSITAQSYGAQLLWRRLDATQPRLLPALFRRLAARPSADEGRRAVAATYARIAGEPFPPAFHRFAVSVTADHGDGIEPAFSLRRGETRRAGIAPLAVHYVRLALPRRDAYSLTVTFPRGRGSAAATLTFELESDVAGEAAALRADRGATRRTADADLRDSGIAARERAPGASAPRRLERRRPPGRLLGQRALSLLGAPQRDDVPEPLRDPGRLRDEGGGLVLAPDRSQRLRALEQRVGVHAALPHGRHELARLGDEFTRPRIGASMSGHEREHDAPPDVDPQTGGPDILRDAHEPLRLVVAPLPGEQETEPPRDVGRGVLVTERVQRVEPVSEHTLGGRLVARHHLDLADRDRMRGRRLPEAQLLQRPPSPS